MYGVIHDRKKHLRATGATVITTTKENNTDCRIAIASVIIVTCHVIESVVAIGVSFNHVRLIMFGNLNQQIFIYKQITLGARLTSFACLIWLYSHSVTRQTRGCEFSIWDDEMVETPALQLANSNSKVSTRTVSKPYQFAWEIESPGSSIPKAESDVNSFS